ncbi:MAG: hypothetical protein DWQ01_00560 [Planctomycetota bacterium]|nr:MAG: hypothetical protein DWQ01_00560 [Planctomycetota bacterium]
MWHQAESELLFGVAVLLGGAEVQLPLIYDVKSPDFIADFRTLRYSVEVKRPSSSKKVARKISSAANQIASFQNQPAVIAVDLTDVLNANIENGNPDQLLSSLDMRLEEMHVAAIRQINRNTRRPGFSRVALLIFYARIIVWQRIRDCWGPSFGLVLRGKLFEGACSGVLADGPGRFLQGIIHGFERVAGGKVWRY